MDEICLLNGCEIAYNQGHMTRINSQYHMQCLCEEDSYIEFTANALQSGFYKLIVKHSSQGDSHQNILIDGEYYGGLLCKSAKDGGESETVCFYHQKGDVTLRLLRNWGEMMLFSLDMVFACATLPEHNPSFQLSNENSSKECFAVMNYFKSIYKTRVLSGQHTDFNCADIAYIKQRTGHEPAIAGFDVMSYSGGTYTDEMTWETIRGLSNCKRNIDAAIIWAKEKKGLVSLCWHWYSPSKGRDKSFYTPNTDFDLAKALAEKTTDYELLLKDLDLIAEQLKRLQEQNIPVLWRPLHEADGKWFWWGAAGADAFKELYRLMYDRFTKLHGLNNLIWVLTAPTLDWYPGDDVVDLISIDVYAPKANSGSLCIEYEKVRSSEATDKPIGLGEIGTVPNLDIMMQKAPWLWFMIWYGFSYESVNNLPENLYESFNCNTIVNLEELANEGLY